MLVTLNGPAEATDVPRAEAAARAILVVRNMTHPPGFLDGVRVYHDEGVVIRIDARACQRASHIRSSRLDAIKRSRQNGCDQVMQHGVGHVTWRVQRHWEGHLSLPEVAYGAFLTSKTMQWRVSKRKGPGIGQRHKASHVLGAEGGSLP